jgi:hypothetical protein
MSGFPHRRSSATLQAVIVSAQDRAIRFDVGVRLTTAVITGLLLVAATATAMVVAQRDFPELVANAEQVVVGTVTDIHVEPDAKGMPYTMVTLSDLRALKGTAGETLTLRFYGGRSGGVVVQVPDMPEFALGERDILFIRGNGHEVCPLVGVWQGRFHVRYDAARGSEVVDSNDGAPVTGRVGRQLRIAPLEAGAAAPAAVTVDEFRQLVADELAHPEAVAQ